MSTEDSNKLSEIKSKIFECYRKGENIPMSALGLKHSIQESNMFDILFDGNKYVGKVMCYLVETQAIMNKKLNNHYKLLNPGNWIDINDNSYIIGQTIVCRDSKKLTDKYDKNKRLFTNFEYVIKTINTSAKELIVNDANNDEYTIGYSMLKSFAFNYCNTIISSQGDTYNDTPIIIVDIDSPHMLKGPDRLYSAISRANKLENVTLLSLPYLKINMKQFQSYVNRRIESYKEQDERANRNFTLKDYVDYNWIRNMIFNNLQCPYCNCTMSLENRDTRDILWSVQRENNDLPHIKENCTILCVNCNSSLK
jgi:hypothetical protein